MAICKVCSSEYLDFINQRIVDKVPFIDLAKELESKGEKISQGTLNRHARNHVKGYTPNKSNNPKSVSDYAQTSDIPKSFQVNKKAIFKALSIDSEEQYSLKILDIIRHLTLELALSCYAELEQHNQGLAQFPKEKFTALKDSLMMQSKLGNDPHKALKAYDNLEDRINWDFESEVTREWNQDIEYYKDLLGISHFQVSREVCAILAKLTPEAVKTLKVNMELYGQDYSLFNKPYKIQILKQLIELKPTLTVE